MEAAVGGQEVPERLAGMARGQAQPDAIAELVDPTPDFEHLQPQGVQLHARHPHGPQPATQRIEQPVGGAMEQEPELIRGEAVVAEPVGTAGHLEIFDRILPVTASHVPGVEGVWRGGW